MEPKDFAGTLISDLIELTNRAPSADDFCKCGGRRWCHSDEHSIEMGCDHPFVKETTAPDGAVLTSSHGLEDELEYERRRRG